MIDKLKEIKNYLYNLKGASEQKQTIHALGKNGKAKLHNVVSAHKVTFNGNKETIAIIEQERNYYAAVLPNFSTTPIIKNMWENDSILALLKEDDVNLYDVVKLRYNIDSEENFNTLILGLKTKNLKGIQTTNFNKEECLEQWDKFTRETNFTEEELQEFATKFKELQNQYNTFLSKPTSNWSSDIGYWVVNIATNKSEYSFPLTHLQDVIEDWTTKVDKLSFPKPKAENIRVRGSYLPIVYEFRAEIKRAAHRPTEIAERLKSMAKNTWMKESEKEYETNELNKELINIPAEVEAIQEALVRFDKEVELQNNIYNNLKEFCHLVNVSFTALMKNQHNVSVIGSYYTKGSVYSNIIESDSYKDYCSYDKVFGSYRPNVFKGIDKQNTSADSNLAFIERLLNHYDSDYLTQTKYMRRLIGKTQQDFEKLFG